MKKTIINSLPKAGTNLMAKCLDLFGYSGSKFSIHAGVFLGNSFKSKIRSVFYRSFKKGYLVGIDMPIEIGKRYIDKALLKLSDNRYCTAHVGYTDDILCKAIELGIIPLVVIRDPRAVLVSSTHYILKKKTHALYHKLSKMEPNDRYKTILYGSFDQDNTLKSLKLRCQSLDPWIKSKNVMCIRFEDIVGKRGGGSDIKQMQILAELCDRIDGPKDKIDYVAENLFGPGKHTFRKGKINSWEDELPKDIIRLADKELKDILIWWGYL